MKQKLTLIFIVVFSYVNAQTTTDQFPFDVQTLATQKAYANTNISPRVEAGTFFYFNKVTNKKEFSIGFEEAYPFIGKSALVKKGGKYGVIDVKGNYIIEPKYDTYGLPPYEDESNLIIFSEEFIFDLNLGTKSENGYIYCAEPSVPSFMPFTNQQKKYGIKNYSDEIVINATYDSIIDIHYDFFVLKLQEKIGVVNIEGKTILPFEYDNVIFSRGDYYTTPQEIGLQKKKKWSYFTLGGIDEKEIITSEFKCIQMHDILLENAIGVFEVEKQFNILFRNGTTLQDNYDWISYNGLVGIRDQSVFFILPDGSSTLYYQ